MKPFAGCVFAVWLGAVLYRMRGPCHWLDSKISLNGNLDDREETELTSLSVQLAVVLVSLLMAATTTWAADPTPAKKLFGAVQLPTKGETESVGFCAKGCRPRPMPT